MEGTRLQQLQEARISDLARNQDAMGKNLEDLGTRVGVGGKFVDITRAIVTLQKGKGWVEEGPSPDDSRNHQRDDCHDEDDAAFEIVYPRAGNRNGNKDQDHRRVDDHAIYTNRQYKKTIKLEVPRFNGKDHRGWLRKYHQTFKFHKIEEDEKVELATMHFEGPVELWYQNFEEDLDKLQWEDFIRELVTRFNSQWYENIEGEFSKLIQTSTVAEYQERFEELRAIVKIENQGLSEKIYINSFISGLKEEIKHQVHMFFPKTLTQAFSIARIQESNLQSQFKFEPITTFHTKPNTTTYSLSSINKINTSSVNSTPSINFYHKPINHSSTSNQSKLMSILPTKRLNQVEMKEIREKSLCYNCDEVYKYGHR